jgi:hypothetical protein
VVVSSVLQQQIKQIAVGGFALCYSIMMLVVVKHLNIEYPEF